jgi:hypothetical protein
MPISVSGMTLETAFGEESIRRRLDRLPYGLIPSEAGITIEMPAVPFGSLNSLPNSNYLFIHGRCHVSALGIRLNVPVSAAARLSV